MKMPDACAVYFPSPSVARLKIEAHITEVQRPTKTKRRALIGTMTKLSSLFMISKIGIFTVIDFGVKIAARIRTIAVAVVQSINVREETLPAMKPAIKRPISMSSQYIAATAPPIVAALVTDSGFTQAPFTV